MPTFVFAGAELPVEPLLWLQAVSPASSAAAIPVTAAAVLDVDRIGASFLLAGDTARVRSSARAAVVIRLPRPDAYRRAAWIPTR
jgi:hypothetical protein